MIRLQINPAYAGLLEAQQLGSYAGVMQCKAGELVEEDPDRDVRRLHLDGKVLYLKRTRTEKTGPAFESYARGRLAHSRPFREMLHFRHLAHHGFDVAKVVATGEELHFGIPQRGFIMTEEVPGESLSWVYLSATADDRRLLLSQFGDLLGRSHAHGFFGSTRLKDIVYGGPPSPATSLTLIDRETRNPYPKGVTAKRIVARLLFNTRRQALSGEIFTEPEWREFCESYCDSLSRGFDIRAETVHAQIIEMLRQRDWLRAES